MIAFTKEHIIQFYHSDKWEYSPGRADGTGGKGGTILSHVAMKKKRYFCVSHFKKLHGGNGYIWTSGQETARQ